MSNLSALAAMNRTHRKEREELETTITELREELDRHDYRLGKTVKSLQATIIKLEEAAGVYESLIVKELQATITELTGLLRAAACPYCDGSGAYYDNMGEVRQCQWCDETLAALKEVDGE